MGNVTAEELRSKLQGETWQKMQRMEQRGKPGEPTPSQKREKMEHRRPPCLLDSV